MERLTDIFLKTALLFLIISDITLGLTKKDPGILLMGFFLCFLYQVICDIDDVIREYTRKK